METRFLRLAQELGAMVPGRCLFLLVFLCNLVRALGNCLNASDVVPVADRINIVVNGESLPIGFSSPDWDSAKIYSRIAEIITQEILGFNTQMGPHGDESQSAYKLVAEGNSIHFLSEIWSSFTAEIIAFEAANPSLALPLLKTLDYKGRDGMHIFPKSSEPYYDSNGRSLEFYQYFNASVLTLTTEFSPISAFDINSLSACDGSESGPTEQSYYLSATGDAGAFTVLNGVRTWNCHQGKWWLSPACRNDPSTCVPLLTHLFWGWSEMRQKAAYFNMPIAMGSTPSAELYVEWPKNHKMLVSQPNKHVSTRLRDQSMGQRGWHRGWTMTISQPETLLVVPTWRQLEILDGNGWDWVSFHPLFLAGTGFVPGCYCNPKTRHRLLSL